ncbi:hypothetical protein C1645_831941 [Glomus cerebriforme]|uniref:Uncharacterized protein n=1 Tax=Glomus cerebriforme TaxID=658196 RepID=A0A397SKK8_9GLOM|nr:hypothetical protein C1645_831941 [Glomus cerebriforme]
MLRFHHPHVSKLPTNTELFPTEDHIPAPMQDIIMLKSLNLSSSLTDNNNDLLPLVATTKASTLTIPMDTLSSNDSLIKKANNKQKKKLKQESILVALTEVV